MKHEELTERVIGAFFNVYNSLRYGFLEKVYRNSMVIELTDMGLKVEKQKRVLVYYKQQVVGEYFADLVIEDSVICELKANATLCEENENQLLNYLRATNIEVGLLFNFGKKAELKRKVYDNEKKDWYTTKLTRL